MREFACLHSDELAWVNDGEANRVGAGPGHERSTERCQLARASISVRPQAAVGTLRNGATPRGR